MFAQIGLAEELGTGMRKISKYIRKYAKHGGIEFFDEDLFRARLPIPPEEDSESVERDTKNVERNTKSVERIFAALKENPRATQAQLADLTGLTRRGVEKNLQQLKTDGRIIRRGGRRYGFWGIAD